MIESIEFTDYERVAICTGTVLSAASNAKARVPAYILRIDFGEWGVKTSSAQLTDNYTPEMLIGKQIVAVTNFPSKRIAGVKSEVLVLGAVSKEHGTVLLSPDKMVENLNWMKQMDQLFLGETSDGPPRLSSHLSRKTGEAVNRKRARRLMR